MWQFCAIFGYQVTQSPGHSRHPVSLGAEDSYKSGVSWNLWTWFFSLSVAFCCSNGKGEALAEAWTIRTMVWVPSWTDGNRHRWRQDITHSWTCSVLISLMYITLGTRSELAVEFPRCFFFCVWESVKMRMQRDENYRFQLAIFQRCWLSVDHTMGWSMIDDCGVCQYTACWAGVDVCMTL